jgi:hypothetical protein
MPQRREIDTSLVMPVKSAIVLKSLPRTLPPGSRYLR